MKYVNTVNGPVKSTELGRTLMHEHFLFGYCGFQGDITLGGFNEQESLNTCIEGIKTAQSYGIKTIVDATTNECGRNPEFLKKLSDITGMNIICSTGYYYEGESSYAYWIFRSNFADVETEIYEMMVTELTDGIAGTGIKAGVIKLGTSHNTITPMEKTILHAAARAQKETGCVIITHTQQGTMGPEQASELIKCGADPNKIAIGHMCGNTDLSYHEDVLKQGVFINMDRFGLQGELFHTPTDEERMDVLKALADKGYGDRILVGHDSVHVNMGRPLKSSPVMEEALKDANIGTIGRKIIPGLRSRGMKEEQIEALLTANPASIFG